MDVAVGANGVCIRGGWLTPTVARRQPFIDSNKGRMATGGAFAVRWHNDFSIFTSFRKRKFRIWLQKWIDMSFQGFRAGHLKFGTKLSSNEISLSVSPCVNSLKAEMLKAWVGHVCFHHSGGDSFVLGDESLQNSFLRWRHHLFLPPGNNPSINVWILFSSFLHFSLFYFHFLSPLPFKDLPELSASSLPTFIPFSGSFLEDVRVSPFALSL